MNAGANETTNLLVIGYGNTLRGDDAAGQVVAEAVIIWNLPGVRALALQQLTPELAEEIAKADRVVFVDASIDPALVSLRWEKLKPGQASPRLGHCIDPRWLLMITDQLYGKAPSALFLTIRAVNLAHGATISAQTQRGIVEALQSISRLVPLQPALPLAVQTEP